MDFTHPHFAEPEWLWLAFMGPLLLFALQRYAARARSQRLALFAVPDLLAKLTASHSPARRWLKEGLLLFAVFMFGLTLARPQWGEQVQESRALGEDILFLMDCSRSMLASDVRPNRLARAKLAVLDFVQRYGRGRIGLVAFAGQAFLQCPLTFDYDAFRESLNSVDDQTIPVRGTDIGRALGEGYLAMEKNDRRKIMVLITDGEDLEKAGTKTAQALADKGVVVFTVGVGTPAGSPIQTLNERGQLDTMRDRDGSPVLSRLDDQTLRAIAQATQGQYYHLGALGEGMNWVRVGIEAAPDRSGASRLQRFGIDRFHGFIAVILLLLVSESLIGTRRRVQENGIV